MLPLDGCPECVTRDNTPYRTEDPTSGTGIRAYYRCRACLWSWVTEWGDV